MSSLMPYNRRTAKHLKISKHQYELCTRTTQYEEESNPNKYSNLGHNDVYNFEIVVFLAIKKIDPNLQGWLHNSHDKLVDSVVGWWWWLASAIIRLRISSVMTGSREACVPVKSSVLLNSMRIISWGGNCMGYTMVTAPFRRLIASPTILRD
ncbi:hypothetical protein FF38_12056 [Lucilia cuprina]|uniref:Uncharacterized protein n=1 Tax=Lucilia cuprina TaxID=7375 RepID=A0A0L0BPG9_LUCCU|nr:hypothetical protein FF38_12056 [Lucilia cuprina]